MACKIINQALIPIVRSKLKTFDEKTINYIITLIIIPKCESIFEFMMMREQNGLPSTSNMYYAEKTFKNFRHLLLMMRYHSKQCTVIWKPNRFINR